MSTRSFNTTLDLYVGGHESTMDVTLHYEYEPAGGDGWNEPRYGESATLTAVEAQPEQGKAIDLLPLLSAACVQNIEADCVQHEHDEREFNESEAVDRLREEALL